MADQVALGHPEERAATVEEAIVELPPEWRRSTPIDETAPRCLECGADAGAPCRRGCPKAT